VLAADMLVEKEVLGIRRSLIVVGSRGSNQISRV
jgi:hypothetical protein